MPKLRYDVVLHGVVLYSTNDINIAGAYKHYTGENARVVDRREGKKVG